MTYKYTHSLKYFKEMSWLSKNNTLNSFYFQGPQCKCQIVLCRTSNRSMFARSRSEKCAFVPVRYSEMSFFYTRTRPILEFNARMCSSSIFELTFSWFLEFFRAKMGQNFTILYVRILQKNPHFYLKRESGNFSGKY